MPAMQIPNAGLARIDIEKLRDYLLSASHPTGRFKAVFFRGLGYTADAAENLEADLREFLAHDAEPAGQNRFGRKYTIQRQLVGPNDRAASIVTVWIVLASDPRPRFVTAYPER